MALLLAMMLSSCMSTYYKTFFLDKEVQNAIRVTDTINNREVILIGMPHLGTEKGYGQIRQFIFDRYAEGFVFFVEGVAPHYEPVDGPYDSMRIDTMYRKLRFVTGFSFGSYSDKDNESLPEAFRNTKSAIDPTMELLGFDSIIDAIYPADLTISKIVMFFEQRFGQIPLTDYDFQTPLNAKYKKRKGYPYDIYAIASPAREMYVVDYVIKSELPKIVIIYGTGHLHHIAHKLDAVGYEKSELRYMKTELGEGKKNKK